MRQNSISKDVERRLTMFDGGTLTEMVVVVSRALRLGV